MLGYKHLFLGIIAMLAFVALASVAKGQNDVRARIAAAHSAMPAPRQLSAFGHFKYFDAADGESVQMTRSFDGMALHVRVSVAGDDATVRQWVKWATTVQVGHMPSGSLSGRKFGQEVWHSFYPSGGQPRAAYTLVCRAGRWLVIVDLMHKITEYEHGSPVEPVFSRRDLRMAEDIAIGCVQRLAKMGYGATADKAPAGGKPGSVAKR